MSKNSISALLPGWLLLGILVSATAANAQQDVIAPPAPASPAPVVQQAGVYKIPDPALEFPTPPDSPLQWGSFILKPHLLYRLLYGNGIQAIPGRESTTAINTFAPGFLLDMGSQWTLDYTPTWDVYSNRIFHNTLGQAVSLAGLASYDDWTIQLNQSYIYSSQPLIETGRQTTEQISVTTLDLSRRLNSQVLSETILNQNLRYAVGSPDNEEWSALEWLHYQLFPQLDTAIGAGGGYINVTEGSNTAYFQPEAEVTFAPISVLSINLTGGLDHREFLKEPRTTLNTPTYSVGVQYIPIETTSLDFTAGRQVQVSYFANESTQDTQWKATLNQRLLGHYYLIASVGEQDVAYISEANARNAGRTDSNLAISVRLRWTFLQRGTFAILYQWDRNSSNASGFGFSSHQTGVEIGYRY